MTARKPFELSRLCYACGCYKGIRGALIRNGKFKCAECRIKKKPTQMDG